MARPTDKDRRKAAEHDEEIIEFIPRSGSDPDLRDELNEKLQDQIGETEKKVHRINDEIMSYDGTEKGDYQTDKKIEALLAERNELIEQHEKLYMDLMIAFDAAFEEMLKEKP